MAASWTVTGDQPGQVQWVGGNPVTGHLITFQTGAGNEGQVFVTDNLYNPAHVRTLVQAQANLADEIATLHS